MSFQAKETVLLTVAGFTHNFGGFLARDMWAEIFNSREIQAHPPLREMILDDLDYEWVYYKVVEEPYAQEEKQAITEAIAAA